MHVAIETGEKFSGNTAANQQCQLTCSHYDCKSFHCVLTCDFTVNHLLVDFESWRCILMRHITPKKIILNQIAKIMTLCWKINRCTLTQLTFATYDTDHTDTYIAYSRLLNSVFHSLKRQSTYKCCPHQRGKQFMTLHWLCIAWKCFLVRSVCQQKNKINRKHKKPW